MLLDRSPISVTGAVPRANWSGDIARDALPTNIPLAEVIVADPPWYPDYFRSFLWAAASLSAPGARVLLGVPALGTRPGIEDEWHSLVTWAGAVGLELTAIDIIATEYLTPPFERNALRAVGINNVPARWRRASIAEFRRVGRCSVERPLPPIEDLWSEVTTGRVRWRLRNRVAARGPGPQFTSPELLPLVEGDVQPNISRQDTLRHVIDVWTSGNRIFRCENLKMLRFLLLALQSIAHGSIEPSVLVRHAFGNRLGVEEFSQAERTAAALITIRRVESEEYGLG
jgi:hypothetical protein